MIVRSHGANVALRSFTPEHWGSSSVIPSPGAAGGTTSTGLAPSWQDAYGLPAVLFCLLLACRAGSQLPCDVYKPSGAGSEKAYDAPQRAILHTDPQGSPTPRALWYVVINGVLGHGNSVVQKLTVPDGPRGRRRVIGLQGTQPSQVRIVRRRGVVRYYLGRTELDPKDIIHIAGDLLDDPEIGVSPLTIARETVATGRAAQIFEGRWYKTDGAPSDIVTWPAGVNPKKQQRDEFMAGWERRHQPGTRRTGQLWGGMSWQAVTVSLKDAEWAATAQISTARAADILGMGRAFIDPENDTDPAETNSRFRELFLQPLLTAIEQPLYADDELFPDKTLFPRFITNALLRPSLKDRAEAYRLLRQGGIATANELRPLEDWPEHKDGDELQATPVGGAPNPAKSGASDFST
jgi:HK97 family phage portal protein